MLNYKEKIKLVIGEAVDVGKQRIIYYDILNILACIAVIALHHNGIVHTFQNTPAWAQSLWVECGLYWAVPIFLMLSGATLMDYRKKYDTKTFLKKRFQRVFVPWICWSAILLVIRGLTGGFVIESYRIGYLINLFFNNKIESTYYFFGAIIGCYFALPVFSLLTDQRKILWYVVALNFIFISVNTLVRNVGGIVWNLEVPVVGSYFLFVCLGFLLDKADISAGNRKVLYFLGIGMVLLRYIVTYCLSIQEGTINTTLKGYVQFHSVILAAAVFVLFKNIPWNRVLSDKVKRVIPKISKYSFGIYLMHREIMRVEAYITSLPSDSVIWRIFMIPVTYGICLLIAMCIGRVPVIKKVIGC